MRLIDADALIAEYDRVHVGEPGGARKLMENAPTVDAVPVVRCKDCFYHGDFDETGHCICDLTEAEMPMDGFCSDGDGYAW